MITLKSGGEKSPQETEEFLDLECISEDLRDIASCGKWGGGCSWGERGHLCHAVNNNW